MLVVQYHSQDMLSEEKQKYHMIITVEAEQDSL